MRNTQWYVRGSLLTCLLVYTGACRDLSPELPAGIADPDVYLTAEASRQQAHYARYFYQLQLPTLILSEGLLTDEYNAEGYEGLGGFIAGPPAIDSRNMRSAAASDITLRMFGEIRRYTQQARHSLAKYASDDPPALQGEMYALEGMTEIYMADVFCSGIPLSTVDFEQDFTYTSQLTTHEVYEHAVALFDTAITLSQDSARVHFFARVGKARALVALGRYAEADTVVTDVPDDFQYRLPFGNTTAWADLFALYGSISTGEGGNGVPFRNIDPNEQDPRVQFVSCDFCSSPTTYPVPRDWWTLASAVDARMIRAEAAVHRNDAAWLSFVNRVRTDSTYHVVTDENGAVDTVWHAGIGGVDGLEPLHDPALDPLPPGKTAMDVRVDLVFRERAFWFFWTGTRQGDLRRLVREYKRPQESVYPTGNYLVGGGRYGKDVNFMIEQDEQYNPHFSQCMGRDA